MTHAAVVTKPDDLTESDIQRFHRFVERSEGCWVWSGQTNAYGYGSFSLRGRTTGAHRVAYIAARGAIPTGLVLDHLCSNRACVNPDHLEAVTQAENVMRSAIAVTVINASKTHCIHGHEYTDANTITELSPNGRPRRRCRTCRRAMRRRIYQRRKDSA